MTSPLPPAPAPLVAGLARLLAEQGGPGYRELLRVPALSLGLYALDAGQADPQQPHGQDEVYVVVAGRATLEVDGEPTAVGPGDVAYVPAGVPHRFVDITEDLRVHVVFAPAEQDQARR